MHTDLRFYEILQQCAEDALTDAFLALCTDAPDRSGLRETFAAFLQDLRQIIPNCCEPLTLTGVRSGTHDIVYAVRAGDAMHYGFELHPWADTLGYFADGDCVAAFGREHFAALVLWEMTFFGFSEDAVRQAAARFGRES